MTTKSNFSILCLLMAIFFGSFAAILHSSNQKLGILPNVPIDQIQGMGAHRWPKSLSLN